MESASRRRFHRPKLHDAQLSTSSSTDALKPRTTLATLTPDASTLAEPRSQRKLRVRGTQLRCSLECDCLWLAARKINAQIFGEGKRYAISVVGPDEHHTAVEHQAAWLSSRQSLSVQVETKSLNLSPTRAGALAGAGITLFADLDAVTAFLKRVHQDPTFRLRSHAPVNFLDQGTLVDEHKVHALPLHTDHTGLLMQLAGGPPLLLRLREGESALVTVSKPKNEFLLVTLNRTERIPEKHKH